MSGFLLGTNVLSELVKLKPESKVVSWIEKTDEDLFYISVLTLGEIRKGITTLSPASRRVAIEAWLEKDLCYRFAGRILLIDQEIADRWGIIIGLAQSKKIVVPVIDGLLAATAIHHNLTLVTRNVKDVAQTGVNLFNPWETTS
ncbi:MAG: type II toxin-antitoxin system VapC family toxin [Elusimicrobia bacterium]|nr:type II toxin-antitoxin system VapC family toxin [Elusimicrobiota bacterium]